MDSGAPVETFWRVLRDEQRDRVDEAFQGMSEARDGLWTSCRWAVERRGCRRAIDKLWMSILGTMEGLWPSCVRAVNEM